jgi:hypothetical protein
VDRDYHAYLKIVLTVLISAVELGLTPASTLQALYATTAIESDDSQLLMLFARVRTALQAPARSGDSGDSR